MPNYERPEVRDLGTLSQPTETTFKVASGDDGTVFVIPGPTPDIILGDPS